MSQGACTELQGPLRHGHSQAGCQASGVKLPSSGIDRKLIKWGGGEQCGTHSRTGGTLPSRSEEPPRPPERRRQRWRRQGAGSPRPRTESPPSPFNGVQPHPRETALHHSRRKWPCSFTEQNHVSVQRDHREHTKGTDGTVAGKSVGENTKKPRHLCS